MIRKLKKWVLKRNDRLFQGGKILRAKLSKLRLDNDYDGVKASELADEAELIFDKAALTEAIMRKRDVGETLSRDEVVHMYELADRAAKDYTGKKLRAEARFIFTAIGSRAVTSADPAHVPTPSERDGELAVALDTESMGNQVRYGDFLAGKGGVKDVVGNLLTVSYNMSRQYVGQNGLGRAELIEQKTFFNLESMRRLGVRHVVYCFLRATKDFPDRSVEEAEAAAEAEWRAEAGDDEEDDGIADDEDSDDLCGNHIPRGGAPLNL